MTPATTTGASRQGDARQTTSRGNGSQHIPTPIKEQDTTIMTHNFSYGQSVRALTGRHAGKIGTIIAGPTSDGWWKVSFPPADLGKSRRFGRYPTEELEAVRTDDTVPASDAEVVEYVTGVHPDAQDEQATQVDEYRCNEPGCDYHVFAVGPVDIDEPDPFQEGIDAHRRSHEPEGTRIHRGWGDVTAVDVWAAVGDFHGLFNVLAAEKSPADVAGALRRLADVLDPEAAR